MGAQASTLAGLLLRAPAAIALGLVPDDLEEARGVLERGEARGRVARAARAAARRRDRPRGAEQRAERERAQRRAPSVAVHHSSLDSRPCASPPSETSSST